MFAEVDVEEPVDIVVTYFALLGEQSSASSCHTVLELIEQGALPGWKIVKSR